MDGTCIGFLEPSVLVVTTLSDSPPTKNALLIAVSSSTARRFVITYVIQYGFCRCPPRVSVFSRLYGTAEPLHQPRPIMQQTLLQHIHLSFHLLSHQIQKGSAIHVHKNPLGTYLTFQAQNIFHVEWLLQFLMLRLTRVYSWVIYISILLHLQIPSCCTWSLPWKVHVLTSL